MVTDLLFSYLVAMEGYFMVLIWHSLWQTEKD